MLTTLRQTLTKLTLKLLLKLNPDYERPVVIHTTPPNALAHIIASIDKKFGSAWDATPAPADSIETIMFRSGSKSYRAQLLKEINATSPAHYPTGHIT